jgi:preprotein translocase subunit SecD
MYFNWVLLLGLTLQTAAFDSMYIDANNESNHNLPTGIYGISSEKTDHELYSERDQDSYYINAEPIIALDRFVSVDIEKAGQDYDGHDHFGLTIYLDSIGKQQLTQASTTDTGVKWAFIIRGELWSAATVYQPITAGALTLSDGQYKKKYLKGIQSIIEADMAELKK